MARCSSNDDAGSEAHDHSKRSKYTPGTRTLDVMFSGTDDDCMTCNVAMLNTLQRKGGYSHSLGCGTRDNLKKHAETWHPELYASLLKMDAAKHSRTAIFEKLEEDNSSINKQRQKGTIEALIKSLSQQGDSTIKSRALFALHFCHTNKPFVPEHSVPNSCGKL